MKRALTAAIAALSIAGTAFAADAPAPRPAPRIVSHNGSIMQVVVLGHDMVDIVYMKPKPELWGYAWPGTVLVHGKWRDGILYATVYSVSRCGPVPYQVSGRVDANEVLVLTGPAPLLDPLTCQVLQWIWSANSVLTFLPLPPPA